MIFLILIDNPMAERNVTDNSCKNVISGGAGQMPDVNFLLEEN
jgi:hypothetical protein